MISGRTLIVCGEEGLTDLVGRELVESGIEDLTFSKNLPERIAPEVENVIYLSNTSLPFIEVQEPKGSEGFSLRRADHEGRRYWQVVSESPRGLYYGLMKFLEGKDRSDEGPGFEIRGVVEGFYGPPWSWEDRSNMVNFISDLRMNLYIYAPKDDLNHREKWRDLYKEGELESFRRLLDTCSSGMIEFCYALSPGLSVDYSSEKDLNAVLTKLAQLHEIGVRSFGLFLDDIPEDLQSERDQESFRSLGQAHRVFAEKVFRGLKKLDAANKLIFCPTKYFGVESTSYHSEISNLPKEIQVFWTGPKICSKEIRSSDSGKIAGAFGRRVLIWDNYPVNDYDRRRMNINAVRNRDPDLPETCVGMVTNPMSEAEASKVAIFTYGEYLWDPVNYDPEKSLERALTYVFGVDSLPLAKILVDSLVDFFFDPDEKTGWMKEALSGGDDLDLELLISRFEEIARVGELLQTMENKQLLDELTPYIIKTSNIGALGKLYIQGNLLSRKIGRNRSRVLSEKILEMLMMG